MSCLCLVLFTAMPVDATAGENPLTTLQIARVGDSVNLSWSDTEDLLKGSLTPALARVGEPLRISLSLAQFERGLLEGPVTMSLRPLNELGGTDSLTVSPPAKGERLWVGTLTPKASGPHRLEFAWSSTHRKVVRGTIMVEEARLAPWVPFAVGATLILVAVGFGAWLVMRRQGAA